MNKKLIWGIVIVIVVMVIGFYALKTIALVTCYNDQPAKNCYVDKFPFFTKKISQPLIRNTDNTLSCPQGFRYWQMTDSCQVDPNGRFKINLTVSEKSYSVTYPTSFIAFQYSCNIDGIAFWPQDSSSHLKFSPENKCPTSLIDSAVIIITTEGKPTLVVKDKKYEEISKEFTITTN